MFLLSVSSFYCSTCCQKRWIRKDEYKKDVRHFSSTLVKHYLIMAALRSRCGHYIFALWFLSSIFYLPSFLFLASSQRSQTGCLPHFYTWCGLSANLECKSEMCCTRLTGNTGRKNDAKNRHLRTTAQLCRAISSQLRHVSTIGKNVLSSNIASICTYNMLNFCPLAAEIVSLVWGTPSKFQQVSHLGSVTARHCSNGRQPNCGVEQRAPPIFGRAAITLGIGPHF